MPEPAQLHEGAWLQLEKADPRVNYRAATGDSNCGNCRFFDSGYMRCQVVEGTVDPSMTSDLWTAPFAGFVAGPGEPAYEMYREPSVGLAFEVSKEFAAGADFSKPMWIPYLPKPGKYSHPLYGEILVTPQRNQEMVDSVKNHVYQENIPIDAEHETKLSGAVGWLKDMRLNEDGSADGFVEWTDRGRALLESGNFKYFSPEWFDDWRDVATGVVHRNVVAGGAITTRPFFKEKILRALVASEAGTEIISTQEDLPVPDNKAPEVPTPPTPTPTPTPAPTPEPEPTPVTFTEAQVKAREDAAVAKALAEAKKTGEPDSQAYVELQTRVTAAEALAASEKAAREALALKLTEITSAERRRRFSDLVAGKGGENDGGAWVGDATKHVAFLEKLADQVGEADEMFTSFVEQQNAAAAQLREAGLFREHGSAAGPTPSDPEQKLETLTKAKMAADPKLTHAQAYSEVLNSPEGAKLYGSISIPR